MRKGPLPEAFEGSVSIVLRNDGEIHEGDTLLFDAKITGNAALVTVHWQVGIENEETHETEWKDLAADERFTLTANSENFAKKIRVALINAEGSVVAAAALTATPQPTAPTAAPTATPQPTQNDENETSMMTDF